MATDFAEKFCAAEGIRPERWHTVAMRQSLYPHARLLHPLIAFISPDFFSADRDFLNGVGRLSRFADFAIEADEFAHHPSNQSFARRVLRLRVSVRRLRSIVFRSFDENSRGANAARLRAATRP